MSSHLIDRVKFDIEAESTAEAKEIQDQVFSICRYQLDDALDASLADDADQMSIIKDRLVLDLGHIPKDVLANQLIPRLLEAFAGAIADLKPAYHVADKLKNDLEALRLYLEKGVKHWSKGDDFDPLNELILLVNNYWTPFLNFLKRTRMQMQVSTRLVNISSDKTYRHLITKLRSSDSDFILGFLKGAVKMMENTKSVAQPKSRWESSLKALILHDLINNHNSLFNRKMFINRQLIGLAARHRIDYLELLRQFDALLAEKEIAYKYHSSLPALIKELTQEAEIVPDDAKTKNSKPEWLILFDKGNWQSQYKQKLQELWPSWISQYPGEMKESFESEVRTVDQVEFIVDQLSDGKVDDVIGILIPHLSKYVISYKKSVIKGNKENNTLTTTEADLRRTLNFLIISYLTLDMGTSFNKREFFTQQIVRISRHYNLAYEGIVSFLVETLESAGEPILFGMMELIRQIGEGLIPETEVDSGPIFETLDELELLYYYLEHGRLHAEMETMESGRPFEILLNILSNYGYTSEIIDFVHRHRSKLIDKVRVYDTAIYLNLIKLMLGGKLALSSQEVKTIISQVKKHTRQSVDQDLFRSYVFEYISGLGKKLKAGDVRKYDLDGLQDPYSLLCRFLIIKLSLDEFYKEILHERPGKSKPSAGELTYDQAHARFYASLDHLMIPEKANQFHQAQLQSSLSKILESKQESQALLGALSQAQLFLLLRHGSKVARYKVLRLLAGKYWVIKVLLEEIDIRVIDDFHVKGWQEIIAMDYDQPKKDLIESLVNALDKLEVGSKIKNEVIGQFNQIKKHQKNERTTEIELLVRFFETAEPPKGWTLLAIETLFLRHYNHNYKLLTKVLRSIIYQRNVIEKLNELLGKNIVMRWSRIMMADMFDSFQNEFGHLEQLISLLKEGDQSLLTQAEMEKLKIIMIYEYQFRKVSFANLTRFFLRFFAASKSKEYKQATQWLHTSIKKEIDEIKPDILKARAREFQELLASHYQAEEQAIIPEKHDEVLVDDNYKIENAGLVLCWPFLKNMFGQLDYLAESGEFKSAYEQSLAVRLLQYAATGDSDQPEYNMTLNKLLCGYPLVEPLERTQQVSDQEKKLADSMLEGLIANWAKLGNTSIEGLRNTFLNRAGSLSSEESNWTLRVEKNGMDVLLDFLPWTITNVKTPWLEGMLFVEWR